MRLPFIKHNTAEPGGAASSDVEVIHAKLVDAEAQIATAEAELDRLALRAVLADDSSAFEATARLDELRHRGDLLTRALAAAEQAERDAVTAAQLRDHQARRRSAAQRAGAMQRSARKITELQAALIGEYARLVHSAQDLVATLPPHMRTTAEPWHSILSERELRRFVEVEGHRLNRETEPELFSRPGGAAIAESTTDGYSLPPLAHRIASLTNQVRDHFHRATPSAPRVQTAIIETAKSEAESQHQPEPGAEAVPMPVIRSVGELLGIVDLRGRDLGVPKTTEAEEVTADA
jgi:hypothetical protein